MFAAEARILGMLHHPNVVQAYDVGESDGTLFLVLEYVDGPSLGRLMRVLRTAERPLPPAFAGHFALEICRALDYVHTSARQRWRAAERDPPRRDAVEHRADLDGLREVARLRHREVRRPRRSRPDIGRSRASRRTCRPEAIEGKPLRRPDRSVLGRRRPSRDVDPVPAVRRGPRPGDLAQGARDADPAALRDAPGRAAGAGRHRHEGPAARSRPAVRQRRGDGARSRRVRGGHAGFTSTTWSASCASIEPLLNAPRPSHRGRGARRRWGR